MTTETDLPYRPCVGVMLINREGLVFVGKRSDVPLAPEGTGHWWQMPQGGLGEGENPEAAALRELEEETGVRNASILGRTRRWYDYDLPQGLIGTAWDVGGHIARGRLEPAAFRAIDGLGLVAHNVGYLASNGVRRITRSG